MNRKIKSQYQGRTILVTGAVGSIEVIVCQLLFSTNYFYTSYQAENPFVGFKNELPKRRML